MVLGVGSLVFLGGVCTKIPQANTKSAASSTNTGSDVNVQTNSVVEINSNTNANSHENTNASVLDTSDWLTYTNEEYGFSFRYPGDWGINENTTNHVSVLVTKLDSLPITENVAPSSSSSPTIQDQNKSEKRNLESNQSSAFSGTLFKTTTTNFFRYIAYIEGGSIDVEYVTYIDDNKVTVRYLEGDNTDFNDALDQYGRTGLIKQYQDDVIDSQVLKQKFVTLTNIIDTFQK